MSAYLFVKSLHVMSMIAWMAGLFYLPRLLIYHVDAEKGSMQSETFKIMERRLLKVITTPAMFSSWLFGGLLIFYFNVIDFTSDFWFHVKLVLVVLMTVFHFALARWVKEFASDSNQRPAKFYRIANEVPTVLMMVIVLLVIMKPF